MKRSVRYLRILIFPGAVLALPGVTVQAVNEVTCNGFESVADSRGVYRIATR